MEAIQNRVEAKSAYYENLEPYDKQEEEETSPACDKADDMPLVDTKTPTDEATSGCYDKSILQPEHRKELLERMLESMDRAKCSEKLVVYDESIGREIYAFSIYGGKVHVSGNEGFEYKAMTYEKLVNASLNKSWNYLFNGAFVDEGKLINTVDGILKYYMGIDNDYRKDNKSDSITNHVYESFQKWCDDHKQKEFHFDGRI